MISLRKVAILALFFLAGCHRDQITAYTIPKEDSSVAPMRASSDSQRLVTWTAPEDWQEQPATEMRQGSFLITEKSGAKADISITGFPGDVGGDLANVNRWRGQVDLPPLDEGELRNAWQKIQINGEPAFLVAIDEKEGGKNRKIIAAILHREDRTWFFKLMGDGALVSEQKNKFLDFLGTVHFSSNGKAEAPMEGLQSTGVPTDAKKPEWKVPPTWKEEQAEGMRLGSFSLVDDGNKADVSVVTLTGAAGGVLENINRWRGQLSLPPVSQSDLTRLSDTCKVDGGDGILVDLIGEKQAGDKSKTRILGAIIPRGDRTWFVKMTGEETLVARQKSAFLDFVKSFHFPDHG